MEREFQRSDCRITTIAIRRKVFRENIDADALAELLTCEFQRQRCDGLFLPLVDNLGVRMPVEQIVNRIRETCELRFVAIDEAQAIGHVPLDLGRNYCDLLIAGTHKWLRAFHGMGIGFAPDPGSQSYITNSLKRWQEDGSLNDPLLAFSKELECNQESRFGETVQVLPLIAASAATQDALVSDIRGDNILSDYTPMKSCIQDAGWRTMAAHQDFRSRVILVEPGDLLMCSLDAAALHRKLMQLGIAATTYDNGSIRLSIPPGGLRHDQLLQVHEAFNRLSLQKSSQAFS